jgi:hypothetical protein
VDESFLSADGKIDPVVSTSSVEFPVAAPDPEQAAVELRSARAAADRAQTFAFLGVGLGVVGILLALLACFSRPRPGSGVLSSRDAAVRRAPGSGGIRAG